MTWDQVEAQWKDYTGSARAHWTKLTDDDGEAITGTKGHLIGRIQKRYDIPWKEAAKQVDEWADALVDIAPTSQID